MVFERATSSGLTVSSSESVDSSEEEDFDLDFDLVLRGSGFDGDGDDSDLTDSAVDGSDGAATIGASSTTTVAVFADASTVSAFFSSVGGGGSDGGTVGGGVAVNWGGIVRAGELLAASEGPDFEGGKTYATTKREKERDEDDRKATERMEASYNSAGSRCGTPLGT